ncbi:hypothetical protein F5144DRAFT_628897 [Chaetomium tenue]|uniref:Uncharacterized protein n=1 Tax=Chaetomium tenue TaxID=1854479 RepID=A0ACB7PCK2_9PEZI|nr:hypothetical protein F5144DRAFT_628897 [Chaetomium globosum]
MNSQDNVHGPQGQPYLGDSINTATRALHAKLNKAILQHFPLALPPHATNPSIYATGLLRIAPIYFTFESLWKDLIDNRGGVNPSPESRPPSLDTPSSQPGTNATPSPPTIPNPPSCEPRILALLQTLHHPLLSRTTPLLTDIHALTNQQLPTTTTPTLTTTNLLAELATLSSYQQEQITRQPNGNNQQSLPPTTHQATTQQAVFLARIRQSVRARPHVLLAYAWVFYMALFSGGRVLRGLLEGAGEGFWSGFGGDVEGGESGGLSVGSNVGGVGGSAENGGFVEAGSGLETKKKGLPLGFFRFETPRDGEDLKVEFKERFGEAGWVLTSEERDEVVREAGAIFEDMILLVEELDGMLGQNKPSDRLGAVKRRGGTPTVDDELAGKTGWKGVEPATGFGAWYLVVGTLLALVGLWARHAWK